MTSTNIIEFAPVLQRRLEQQIAHAAYLGRSAPWRTRYRDGIDGLLNPQKVRTSPGEVVPFVATGSSSERGRGFALVNDGRPASEAIILSDYPQALPDRKSAQMRERRMIR